MSSKSFVIIASLLASQAGAVETRGLRAGDGMLSKDPTKKPDYMTPEGLPPPTKSPSTGN